MRTRTLPESRDRHVNVNVRAVSIDLRPFALQGRLILPSAPTASIVFGNGTADWHWDSPAGYLAASLHRAGFAFLVLDLLAPAGPMERMTCFETALLASRIMAAADWLGAQPELAGRGVGCLAFGTAGAAAVIAASERPSCIGAVVAADPRLDAVEPALLSLKSPLLMIAARGDREGSLSAETTIRSVGGRQMQIRSIPGRFGDPSRARMNEIVRLATPWYERYLVAGPIRRRGDKKIHGLAGGRSKP